MNTHYINVHYIIIIGISQEFLQIKVPKQEKIKGKGVNKSVKKQKNEICKKTGLTQNYVRPVNFI